MSTDVTIADLLRRQKVLPLFTCSDAATGLAVVEALHQGGLRVVEFTNRSAGALDVFRTLVAEAATRLGAALIKVFPADALGGPAFIKAVRGPCPGLRLMPSGGVTLDEANLRAWFAAGVHCVGMGSHLVDAATLQDGRFADLADRTRRLVTMLAGIA